MQEIKKNMLAKRGEKGFTLMEMLIVVAIIAILVAIAIPVFNTQLTKARQGVDQANARTAESLAVTDAMTQTGTFAGGTYYGIMGANSTMTVATTISGDGYNQAEENGNAAGSAYVQVVLDANYNVTTVTWVTGA